jgi:hypothetical protein
MRNHLGGLAQQAEFSGAWAHCWLIPYVQVKSHPLTDGTSFHGWPLWKR